MKRCSLTKVFAVLLIFSLILPGCGKKVERPDKTKPEQPTREASAGADTGDTASEEEIPLEEMEHIKYNYYIQLNNQIIEILDSIEYYYQVVDYTEEFSLLPDTGLTYGYRVYGNNTDILEDCLLLADMEPSYGEMDTLVKNMADSLGALMITFSDISRSNDYADNQYQKAKEYHEIIYTNADAFVDLGYAFVNAVGEMGRVQMEKDQEKMKEEGNLIIYNASRAISIGKAVLDEAYDQGVSDENLTDLDLTKIRELYDELVAVVADFDAATADNDQLIKESLSNSRPFDGLYDSLIQALEWVMKQAESGTLPDMSGSGAPLGSLSHFSYVLGQCIDRYNSVFAE